EFATDVLDRRAVLRPEVGQRLEVRGEPANQPHQLEVLTRFPLQPARRLDPVQVTVDVDLEHRRRVVARPARVRGIHPLEPKPRQVKLSHEGADDADRVFLGDILVNPLREQRPLGSIGLIDESAHSSSSTETLTQYYGLNMTLSHSPGRPATPDHGQSTQG